METHMSSGSHLQADPQTDGSMCGGDSGGAYFITNDCGWPELVGVHTASDSEDCKTGKTNWADNLRHSDFKSWICSTTSNKLAYCTDSGACTPRPDKLEGFAHGTCCTVPTLRTVPHIHPFALSTLVTPLSRPYTHLNAHIRWSWPALTAR